MKEPYTKGLATRGGPESCALARKGSRSVVTIAPEGEALTGESPGWVLSHEILFGVRTTYGDSERNIEGRALASDLRTPRVLRPHAWTDAFCAGIGRSRLWPAEFTLPVRTLNPKGARWW